VPLQPEGFLLARNGSPTFNRIPLWSTSYGANPAQHERRPQMIWVAPLAAALLLAGPRAPEASQGLDITVEPGVSIDRPALRQFLDRCAKVTGKTGPVILRIVSPATLRDLAPTPAGKVRLGRTYRPKKVGDPPIVYVAKSRGFWRTLAHEWVHAMDFWRPESHAEALAERCLNASVR